MGRIIVTEFMSIDGVIQAPGGVEDEDYKHVGWSFEFESGEEGKKFKEDETFGSEALLLGRITYETFALAWPTIEGELADKLNHDAQVRDLEDTRRSGLEQHHCARR
jgi:dihydrofolate reductase